jgi:flagellar hook-associated protein 1
MATNLFAVGTRAMGVNAAMLSSVSNNISNANTEGYSRQEVKLETESSTATGHGFMGRGVRIATIDRASDPYLTSQANQTASLASADVSRLAQLRLLENALPLGESGIGYAAGEMLNAFVDIANQPQDLSARLVMLSKAEELSSRMQAASSQLVTAQAGIVTDLQGAVVQVNALAEQLATTNTRILASNSSGHTPNDLMDQRDLLVKKLNELIQISTINAPDGTASVFVGGQNLVQSNFAETLTVSRNEFDQSMAGLSISDQGNTIDLEEESLMQGGRIGGLLQVQNNDLVDIRNQIGQMAAAIAWSVNQQQALGIDLSSPAQAGSPIFKVGEPQVLASVNNVSPPDTLPLNLSVVDARYLQASDYSLVADADNPGQYIVTRLSDGHVNTLVDGDTFDGLQLNITDTINNADKFLLRPVGVAALQMTRVLDKPSGIAAASPFTAVTQAANTGTASVESLTIKAQPDSALPPSNGDAISIVFTSASGDYELQSPPGSAIQTGTWSAGQAIAYNGFELKLNGVPQMGDAITVEQTAYPMSNNGNALSILALRDANLVGREQLTSGAEVPGNTISNTYSQIIGQIGASVQSAQTMSDISTSLAQNTNDLLMNMQGVNLDEEAARLIQYQQSYQASAKILQIAQRVFDTMLSIGN